MEQGPDFRHYESFIAVAEECSFRKAAEKLHITQPALSGHIKVLEEWLGQDVFKRAPSGSELLKRAETCLSMPDTCSTCEAMPRRLPRESTRPPNGL